MSVSPEQQAEIVEPGHDALELHAINKEYSERDFIFPDEVQKSILQVLRALRHSLSCSFR
jgi:hypothetical protein